MGSDSRLAPRRPVESFDVGHHWLTVGQRQHIPACQLGLLEIIGDPK
jgi:hypothetical protein